MTDLRRTVERGLTLLVFLGVAAFAVHKIFAYDVWWQIKTGEWIARHGLPESDPFSYAFPGRPWVEPRWLFCLLVYGVFRTLGLNALILLELGFALAAFGLLRAAGAGKPRWATLVGLALALAVAGERLTIRPELVSFVALCAMLLCLERWLDGGAVRWLYPLPLVQLVWSNAHGLWILGPVVLGIVWSAEWVQGRLRPLGAVRAERLRPLGLAAAAVGVAAAANPYGRAGLLFPFTLLREIGSGHVLSASIEEFQGPLSATFLRADYRTLAYFAVIALAAAGFALAGGRLRLSRLALWLAFLVLSLKAQRNVALFGFVSGHVTLLNLAEHAAENASPRSRWLPRAALGGVALYLGLLIPLLATDAFYLAQGSQRRFGFGVSDRRFPLRALAFIHEQGLPLPVLNTLGDGGYVLFDGGPQSVYVDGRLEVYTPADLLRALGLGTRGAGFGEETRRLGVRTVLVRNDPADAGLLGALARARDWRPVYFDARHVVYLKREPATAALIERLAFDWEHPIERRVRPPAGLDPPDWLAGLWPRARDNFESERLASLFLALGNYERAARHFEQALLERPHDLRSSTLLALLERARSGETAEDLLATAPASFREDADVQFLAGELAMRGRRPALALRHYRRALELAAGPSERQRALARAALAAGELELAEGTLRGLTATDPDDAESWNLTAVLALKRDRLDQAAAHFERSLALDPDQPRTAATLAEIYERLRRGAETERREARSGPGS